MDFQRSLAQPYFWIDKGIEQIHYQVDSDEHGCDNERGGLDDRKIPLIDGIYNPLSNTGP